MLISFSDCSNFSGSDDDQVAADTAVINIINNTGYQTRFLLAESDELVTYTDFFDEYWFDPNYTEVIIEPGINNSESYTLDLGDELTVLRDWGLQYVDPDFPLDWRPTAAHELMDRYVFQAGKTYTITIISINVALFGIDFTMSCDADPVVKVVNLTDDTCWYVFTESDDCVIESINDWQFGNGYIGLLTDHPEGWGEGTSEIASGIIK